MLQKYIQKTYFQNNYPFLFLKKLFLVLLCIIIKRINDRKSKKRVIHSHPYIQFCM